MANLKSSKKKARQSEKKRVVNASRKTEIKSIIKKFLSAVENKEEKSKVQNMLNEIASKLGRAKSKGVIHGNTIARKLSNLTKRFNQTYASPK